MLFHREKLLAFAHYPKTAGVSIGAWMRQTFPGCEFVAPDNRHLPVRRSMRSISACGFLVSRSLPSFLTTGLVHALPKQYRIFGVIREPFEMLVSLYEFWRDKGAAWSAPRAEIVRIATSGSFRDFLGAVVRDRGLPPFEEFYDVGGPWWSNTRLLEFRSLDTDVRRLCLELHIPAFEPLPRLNTAADRSAGGRDVASYAREAGLLKAEVRRYFRWYYEHGAAAVARSASPRVATAVSMRGWSAVLSTKTA